MTRTEFGSSQSAGWCETTGNLDAGAVEALANGEIGALRVPGVASAVECAMFLAAAREQGFDYYVGVDPPIGKLGVTQFEHKTGGKHDYFLNAPRAQRILQTISSDSFSPLERITAVLGSVAPVMLGSETGEGDYFAGLIRYINQALLHVDWGPLDGPDWTIGSVQFQLSWNIYLDVPDVGGECLIYRRCWNPGDESAKLENSYGYDHSVVRGIDATQVRPIVGDLVIFNSKNFHEVLPGDGDRVTVSSFIGYLPNERFILWS